MFAWGSNGNYLDPQLYFSLTVCPGSSDPPENVFNIFASEMRFTPFINYCNTLGYILFVYRAK